MYSTKYRSWHQLCLLTNHENPRHGQKSIVTSSGLNRFAKIDSNIRTDITEKLPDVRMQPQIEEAIQGGLPCPCPYPISEYQNVRELPRCKSCENLVRNYKSGRIEISTPVNRQWKQQRQMVQRESPKSVFTTGG